MDRLNEKLEGHSESASIQMLSEDEEVIAQGSVLHQVFSSFRTDFEVSSQLDQKVDAPTLISSQLDTEEERINQKSLFLVKILYTSGLMLDEDVEMLCSRIQAFEDYTECDSTIYESHRNEGANLLRVERLCHILRKCFSLVFRRLTIDAIQWDSWFPASDSVKLKKSFYQIISEIKETCDLAKKTESTLRHGFATMKSKTIELQIKSAKSNTHCDYYRCLEYNLSAFTRTYIDFIVKVLQRIIEATKVIIGFSKHPNYYVALVLGDKLNSWNEHKPISFSGIPELFSLLVVAQSEYFRALGLHVSTDGIDFGLLCQDVNHLAGEINRLRKIASTKLSRGIYYEAQKEIVTRKVTEKYEDSFKAHLDSKLTSLLTETFGLKDYLSEHKLVSEMDVNFVLSNLSKIKNAVDECSQFIKKNCNSDPDTDAAKTDLSDVECRLRGSETIVKTGIQIGNSDYKVRGEDGIFMCVTQEDDKIDWDQRISESCAGEDESPVYPAPLMAELNFAVEKKRLEFEQREMQVIEKSNLKVIDDEFDLVVLHKPLIANKQLNCKEQPEIICKEIPPLPPPPLPSLLEENCGLHRNSSEYEYQKSLAALAANKSMLWTQEEEVFGDGSEGSSNND